MQKTYSNCKEKKEMNNKKEQIIINNKLIVFRPMTICIRDPTLSYFIKIFHSSNFRDPFQKVYVKSVIFPACNIGRKFKCQMPEIVERSRTLE